MIQLPVFCMLFLTILPSSIYGSSDAIIITDIATDLITPASGEQPPVTHSSNLDDLEEQPEQQITKFLNILELDEQTAQHIATLLSKKLTEHQSQQTMVKRGPIMNNPEKRQMIFSRIALMIANLVGILKNPRDKETIITNVGDIFEHALNIAAHSIQK